MHCFVPIYKTSKETEEKQNNFTVSISPILRKLLVFIPTSPFTYCGVMLAYIFFSPSGLWMEIKHSTSKHRSLLQYFTDFLTTYPNYLQREFQVSQCIQSLRKYSSKCKGGKYSTATNSFLVLYRGRHGLFCKVIHYSFQETVSNKNEFSR